MIKKKNLRLLLKCPQEAVLKIPKKFFFFCDFFEICDITLGHSRGGPDVISSQGITLCHTKLLWGSTLKSGPALPRTGANTSKKRVFFFFFAKNRFCNVTPAQSIGPCDVIPTPKDRGPRGLPKPTLELIDPPAIQRKPFFTWKITFYWKRSNMIKKKGTFFFNFKFAYIAPSRTQDPLGHHTSFCSWRIVLQYRSFFFLIWRHFRLHFGQLPSKNAIFRDFSKKCWRHFFIKVGGSNVTQYI